MIGTLSEGHHCFSTRFLWVAPHEPNSLIGNSVADIDQAPTMRSYPQPEFSLAKRTPLGV